MPVVGFSAYFVMYDYPETAAFPTGAEKSEVMFRLTEDRSVLANEFDMKYFWHALRDWKIWIHSTYSLTLAPVDVSTS